MLPNENYLTHFARPIHSQAMRQAARGERCTLEIIDACNGRTDTTVLAHLPDGGIMGGKVDDLSAAFACHACHDVIDGRRPWPDVFEEHQADYYMRRAQTRTLRRLRALGILTIKGDKP